MSAHGGAESIIHRLRTMRVMARGEAAKQLNCLFLLTIVRLYKKSAVRDRHIRLDQALVEAFSEAAMETFPQKDPHSLPIEYPFVDLTIDSIWKLKFRSGKEGLFRQYSQSAVRLNQQQLVETVEAGYLDDSLDTPLRDLGINEEVEKFLLQELKTIAGADAINPGLSLPPLKDSKSLFAHEAAALDRISQDMKSHGLGLPLQNLELHDPQSNRYFEVDLAVLSQFGIYAVELKHWSGLIEVRPNSWLQNGSFFKADPHKANNFKAKLLRGIYERRFPQFPSVYFESVVVLTNPDVSALGTSIPTTTAHNPTFESIDRFLQYLKNQRKSFGSLLTESQCQAYADHVRKLHTTGVPRDFVFPGYEIVERLYQHIDRAEVIAKRIDVRHRRLNRLRIFYPSTDQLEAERYRAHERATATLNAVAKVGDHPNVLKVWAIPNENNYLVEGSDWSETGTLRDVLDRGGVLDADRARGIAVGLTRGLCAIHEQSVVHRAVCPENVLMVDDTPKLMNFDLSFQLEDDRVTVIPDVTKLRRSPYIAPEIYAGGDIPDGKADLFSVGVILFEMLTGERPFGCSTDLERSQGRLSESHRQKLVNRQIPTDLLQLVLDLVQQEPSRRPADASVVLKRLEPSQEPTSVIVKVNPQLTSGEQCGLYAIEELVKYGSESQIYRAVGVGGRKIALKVFDRDVPQQRIVNEHRFTGTILHPTIERVDSYGQWSDNRYFIAFEWVSQRNLRNDIEESLQPDVQRFSVVAKQILNALAALHQNSDEDGRPSPILHNDIKPENILLADRDRPVLVDFGAASGPHVGTYEGTEGYVPPDLRLGQDRQYSEDGDRYALAVTLHEWLLGTRSSNDVSASAKISGPILDWLNKGGASDAAHRFVSIDEMREAFAAALAWKESASTLSPTASISSDQEAANIENVIHDEVDSLSLGISDPNSFVSYLNSLHGRSAETDNALAEAQALNPFFSFIQVPHPLVEALVATLLGPQKRHVIVTGHAGDGKSTIALELIKRLREVPVDEPLSTPLTRREDLVCGGISISLIKDFSEWSPTEREDLVNEMLTKDQRFFLVSNTGTMLETFRAHEQTSKGDWMRVESELLGAMGNHQGNDLEFHGSIFGVFNIAMIDNLGIAEQIFKRMLAPDRWQTCHSAVCRDHCPIFRNVILMQANQDVITERLFLAYRRMYEFGARLTLRQLSAHMAYMITSDLSFEDVLKMSQRAKRPLMAEYMFFNRFFGDNGSAVDAPALQIRAVRDVRDQGFGAQSSPTWERELWLTDRGSTFKLSAADVPDDFEFLHANGAGLQHSDLVTPAQAREQIRRAVFFLHRFDKTSGPSFLTAFLRSVMLLDFARWQTQPNETMNLQETRSLHRHVMHVLQEHFTGVRLPEGAPSDRHLFVTLSRRSHDVRQSAQIVLARYPDDDFEVRLRTESTGAGGIRRELILEWKAGTLSLPLRLPFLDYVMMRSKGEVGRDLQASYVDRLERFKGQLIRRSSSRRSDDIMLVRLRPNNTFRRQVFSVHSDRLEVTDG